jgi:hypothetical protein
VFESSAILRVETIFLYTIFRAGSQLPDTTLLRFGPFEANTYTGELGNTLPLIPQGLIQIRLNCPQQIL